MSASPFLNTDKQRAIMKLVLEAADEGRFISLQELRLRYSPGVSDQAVTCSLRFLAKHGMVEKVYGDDLGKFLPGKTMYIKPTSAAYTVYRPGVPV